LVNKNVRVKIKLYSKADFVNKPLFIFGVPRSGTTLISMILNQTREIYIPPETHYFEGYLHRYTKINGSKNKEKYKVLVKMYLELGPSDFNSIGSFEFSDAELNNIYSSSINGEYNAVTTLNNIMELVCIKNNVKQWGEKTPNHFRRYEEIKAYYPTATFINIYRDPRDVVLSLSNVGFEKGHIFSWIRNWRLNIESMHNGSIFNIKYEDLLVNTEEVLSNLFFRLNILNKSITDDIINVKNPNFSISKEPWKKKNLTNRINSDNRNKWKTEMRRFQIVFITLFLRDYLLELKYEIPKFTILDKFLYLPMVVYYYIVDKLFILKFNIKKIKSAFYFQIK